MKKFLLFVVFFTSVGCERPDEHQAFVEKLEYLFEDAQYCCNLEEMQCLVFFQESRCEELCGAMEDCETEWFSGCAFAFTFETDLDTCFHQLRLSTTSWESICDDGCM